MKDDASDTHAAKFSKRKHKLDSENVVVEFSPEIRGHLTNLAEEMHNSPHYNADLYPNLVAVAKGHPMQVEDAINRMVEIAEETTRHILATGDKQAEYAFNALKTSLIDPAQGKVLTISIPAVERGGVSFKV